MSGQSTVTKVAWKRVVTFYATAFGGACLLAVGLALAGATLFFGQA